MLSEREQIETTVAAFVANFLDEAFERHPDQVKIGTFGFVCEYELAPEQEGEGPFAEVAFTCSDHRGWVQAGLFRRAMLLAEKDLAEEDED